MQINENVRRWGIDISAGLVSSILSKTVVAPFERVKLLMQTSSTYGRAGPLQCVRTIYTTQGFNSFWKGNVANILRYFPNSTLNFAFKDRFREFFIGNSNNYRNKKINFWKMFWGSLLSGGLAGGVCLVGSHPLDIIRTKFAADMTSSTNNITPLFRSKILGAIKLVYLEGIRHRNNKPVIFAGVSALYRGFGLALTGMVLYKGLYMGGYDILLETLLHNNKSYISMKKFIAAWTLTLVVGTICYPFDTIRRRLMMQVRDGNGNLIYTGGLDCFRKMVREEGYRAFFNGISANMLRSIGGALVLFSYNEIKSFLL